MSSKGFEENKMAIDRMNEMTDYLYKSSQFSKIIYISGEKTDPDLI